MIEYAFAPAAEPMAPHMFVAVIAAVMSVPEVAIVK
jgi:hypothetical protein